MNLSIKQLPMSDRPRERLLSTGVSALTDAELIALVFRGDLSAAGEVLARIGAAPAIRRAVVGELCAVPGVGVARACQLLAGIELGFRSFQSEGDHRAPVSTPVRAWEHLSDLARLELEELHVLALDSRHRLLGRFCAARGAINVVHVSPRDLFRRLLREGATAAVIAHNHPSGDPLPSPDDVELTRRLRSAGDLLGVTLTDHLVIAAGGYYSFTAERLFRDVRPPARGDTSGGG